VAKDADCLNIVSILITGEYSHDTTEFGKILNSITSKSKIFYWKGFYDSRSNFNFFLSKELMQLFYQGRIFQHYQEILHIEI